METNNNSLLKSINPITQCIIGCAFTVSNTLGAGFLEKVYENSLAIELSKSGLGFFQQMPVSVKYSNLIVGEYVADFVVKQKIILEIKAVRALESVHAAQCLNYLKATNLPLALLINFGNPKVQIKRFLGKSNQK